MLKNLALLLLLALLLACAKPSPGPPIADLQRYPQNASFYLSHQSETANLVSRTRQQRLAQRFVQRYFLPWHAGSALHSSEEVFWGHREFADQALYGENLRPHTSSWWKDLIAKASPGSYPNAHQKAITVRTTHMRVLPTHKPAFLDPDQPGQGYPFDMFQNSVLWANTPVLISHKSSQRGWYLVETDWAFGWIPARDIAFVSETLAKRYQTGHYMTPVRDKVPVYDSQGRHRLWARIGSILPLDSAASGSSNLLVAVPDENRNAILREARLARDCMAQFPLSPRQSRVAGLADELLGQPYGWGGLYAQRDCSSTLRDLFAPFGLWLPRNSAPQAKAGQSIELEGLSEKSKAELIKERGLPFFTLLSAPGHIMLYIGQYQGRAAIFHTMWGVRTWDLLHGQGRHIVGSTVITSLTPGRELSHAAGPGSSLLSRLKAMTLLPPRQVETESKE